MKKFDNFVRSLNVLKTADLQQAALSDIYRTGVLGQFNLTFELAWKALQKILRRDGVPGSETGSARDILKLGFRAGYISDSEIWIDMLKKRNLSVHIYDAQRADEILSAVFDGFIKVFDSLAEMLKEKILLSEEDSWNQ